MFTYPQGHRQFYENQRHWDEAHHPLSMRYNFHDENNYYFPDRLANKRYGKDQRRYDAHKTHNRKNEGTFDKRNVKNRLETNKYIDLYHQNPYYYQEYQEEEDDENNDFYYYQHNTKGHFNNRHEARSASPSKRKDRKRQHHRHHQNSNASLQNEAWMQPTPFVNHQPMIMNPMMNLQHQQQILGTCTTDAMMPTTNFVPTNTNTFGMMPQAPQHVPMMNHNQPYFLQLPPSANFPFAPSGVFHHPQQQQQQPMFPFVQPIPPQPSFNDLFNNLTIQDSNTDEPKKNDTNTAAKQEAPPTQEATTAPSTPTHRPTQRPLQRRRSMMETVLSSFSLLGDNQSNTIANKSWDPTTYVSLNEALKLGTSKNNTDADAKNDSAVSNNSLSPRSSFSASAIDDGNATLSRRDSLKLSQKMNALQSRQYIWCYKPQNEEAALWAAFDVKNQRKLDHHYAMLMSKKQQQQQHQVQQQQQVQLQQQQKENDKEVSAETTSFLPDDVITLSKQSQLFGPVMVSLNKSIAWCFDNDSSFSFGSGGQKHILLDVACLPSQQNRFVVSNQLISKDPVVRRSKSVDGGLATKFINSVLKW